MPEGYPAGLPERPSQSPGPAALKWAGGRPLAETRVHEGRGSLYCIVFPT